MSRPFPYNIRPLDLDKAVDKVQGSRADGSERLLRLYVGPELSNSDRVRVGLASFAKGQAAPLHFHEDAEEINVVLAGSGYLYREDGTAIPLRTGDVQHVPAGAYHGHGNPGGEAELHLLFIYTPPTALPRK